jgi:DNA repair ATPase RecN
MAGESVSFRITRTTEDLAQTVAALSQRLVKLEQRLEALALQLDGLQTPADPDPDEVRRLDQVAVLLADCRNLLEDSQPLTAGPPLAVCGPADAEEPLAA